MRAEVCDVAVRFWTEDVERDVRELESRSAVFEDYDSPTLGTVDHVATTPGIGKSACRRQASTRAERDATCLV
jgi:hypothetical protein